MPIRVLPQETAAKIAAGEVVGRPADVVRELLDNAIDADASQIRIELRAGGIQLIRLVDNGCGIPAAEVAIAFERHATSKISEADDLYRLRTLGFRGEALPSIAAVAEVTLVTKALDEDVGSYIHLIPSSPPQQGPRACGQGTTITVRNIFQNVPARLKYLRSSPAETAQIGHVVSQYALAHPQVRFTVVNDGRSSFHSDGTGRLHDAIVKVYGADVAAAMVPVELDASPGWHVYGYVSLPKVTRATRGFISFFVNRRCIQNRTLVHAVEEAYHALLPSARHPIAVLNIELPPDEVDVNIHPAKAEVKFLRDRDLYSKVQRAVRETLTDRLSVSAMVTRSVTPIAGFQQHLGVVGNPDLQPTTSATAIGTDNEQTVTADTLLVESPASTPMLRVLGQVGGTFIIAEGPNGVFLIDQHRAHERVLYEQIKKERASATIITTQLLLTPVPVELSARQASLLAGRLDELAALGFDLEPFGERTFLLRAVPASLRQSEVVESIGIIVDQAVQEQSAADWQERMIATMACKGAIKSGQTLAISEMRELVAQLEATSVPPMCPHGGPVMVHLSQAQLERHFGRR